MDDLEYANETTVIFDTRISLVEFSPLLIDHFLKLCREVNFGDRNIPDKPSKIEVLLVAAPAKSYNDPETYDNENLSPLELGNGKYLPIVDCFCYLGTILTRNCGDTENVLNRIKCAGNAFGSLRKALFSNSHVS